MTKITNNIKSWVGTPFRYKKSEKNIGCDCIGMAKSILAEYGYDIIIPQEYSYIVKSNILLDCIEASGIKETNRFSEINLAIFKLNSHPDHLGFVINGKELVHAYMQARKVVIHSFEGYWKSKLYKLYKVI